MFWKTVNVKDPWEAVKKRGDSRRPITVNNRDQVEFLEQSQLVQTNVGRWGSDNAISEVHKKAVIHIDCWNRSA